MNNEDKIRGVIDRVLWTAGATEDNRRLLAEAISESLAAPAVANAAAELSPLPQFNCTFADHSYPAYNKHAMTAYGQACFDAALAARAPKAALTDDMIIAYWLNIDSWPIGLEAGENIAKFARAIEAAAAPNAALVAALRETLRQAEGWYEECRGGDASDFGWYKEAVAALAAAGVKP